MDNPRFLSDTTYQEQQNYRQELLEHRRNMTPVEKLIEKLDRKKSIAHHKAEVILNRAERLRDRADRLHQKSLKYNGDEIRYHAALDIIKNADSVNATLLCMVMKVK